MAKNKAPARSFCEFCRSHVVDISLSDERLARVSECLGRGSWTVANAEIADTTGCSLSEAVRWTDHVLECVYAWPLSLRDEEVLQEVCDAFRDVEKPRHFTNYLHCEECKEHDDTLGARTRTTIRRKDLGNSGWDPITFSSAQGMAYYFPAMARLALLPSLWSDHDWYIYQLLWHLSYKDNTNKFFLWCNSEQRKAVYDLLEYLASSRISPDEEDELRLALDSWMPVNTPLNSDEQARRLS